MSTNATQVVAVGCWRPGRGIPAAALPQRRPDIGIERGEKASEKQVSEKPEDLINLQLNCPT